MTAIQPMTREQSKTRHKNSVAIGLALGLLVLMFYAVTIVRLQGNVAKRSAMSNAAAASVTTTASAITPSHTGTP